MNSGDRHEFDTQMGLLCAGFNVPVGDRSQAYWTGMIHMSLVEFTRCVEYALGEEGPDRIPTCSQLWGIRKQLRTQARAAMAEQRAPEVEYTEAQQRLTLLLIDWLNWHCRNRGPVIPQNTARAMYADARELAGQLQVILDDHDPDMTPRKFLDAFCDRVLPLYDADEAQRYRSYVLGLRTGGRQAA